MRVVINQTDQLYYIFTRERKYIKEAINLRGNKGIAWEGMKI